MKSAVSAVLLLLAASGAHGFLSFPPVTLPPAAAPPTTPSTTISSSATCTSHSDSVWVSSIEDNLVKTFKAAVARTCSANKTLDQVLVEHTSQMVGAAHAIVNMTVDALSTCTTTNNAVACGKARSFAATQASALMTVVAKAYALAINNCTLCDGSARAHANELAIVAANITAAVSAQVRAKVCIGPNSSASAAAYVTCSSQMWAHGLAYAMTKAMIAGTCFGPNGLLTADATSKVDALITVDPYCACRGFSTYCDASGCDTRYNPISEVKMKKIYGPLRGPIPSTWANFVSECNTYATEIPVVINSFKNGDWQYVF